MRKWTTVFWTVIVLAISSLARPPASAQEAGGKSLYQRLGGKKGIKSVVNDFATRCAADQRISSYFAQTVADPKRLADFKQKLADQICEAAGGPCKYTGKDMKSAHKGMGVTSDAFNYLVEDLATTLGKLKVGPNEQNELIGLLAPMKADIVEK